MAVNGILLVRVVEARNLVLDADNTNLPYAVIEFDKNEFVAETSCTSLLITIGMLITL